MVCLFRTQVNSKDGLNQIEEFNVFIGYKDVDLLVLGRYCFLSQFIKLMDELKG